MIHNKSFQNISKLKYLGTMLTDVNDFCDEIVR